MKVRFSKNPHVKSKLVSVPRPLRPQYFLARDIAWSFLDLDPPRQIIDTYELVVSKNPRTGRTYYRYNWVGERP